MKTTDFSIAISVDQSAKEIFDAINNPGAWWSGNIEGNSSRLNDEFTYSYKAFHMSRQRVIEMIPEKKVVWLVVDSQINYVEDKSEWTGTKMIFEITEQESKTQLRFTHQGLVPEVACFDSCSNSWSRLIGEALFTLISTGKSREIVLA